MTVVKHALIHARLANLISFLAMCCLLVSLLLMPLAAMAAEVTWTAGDGDWDTASNWNTNAVPTAADTAVVKNGVTVEITNSGARAGRVEIAHVPAGIGTIVVDGANDIWSTTTTITVGQQGVGTLDIRNGALVNAGDISVALTHDSGVGTVTVQDNAVLTFSSDLVAGFDGTATVTVSDGGILRSTSSSAIIELGLFFTNGSGTLNIGEGGAAGFLDVDSVQGGGEDKAFLNINHNESEYYFTNDGTSGGDEIALEDELAVTHSGTGTTIFNDFSRHTEPTTVNAGTLLVAGSSGFIRDSTVTVNAGGTFGGDGRTIDVIVTGGTLAPGMSVGTLNTEDLVLDNASTLAFELDTPGIVGGGTNDLVAITGNLTLDGTLELTDLGSLGAGTYTLLTYTGALTDNGLDVNDTFPGLDFVVVDTGSAITLEVTVATFELDYSAGANGSLTGSSNQTVDYNNDGSTVTAVPDTGFEFVRWSDGSAANPRTDTGVTGDVNVEAQFQAVNPDLGDLGDLVAVISGNTVNLGTLLNVRVSAGAELSGGTLLGGIDNAGTISDVVLGTNAELIGGTVSGEIIGSVDSPALLNTMITAGTFLNNVRIGADSQLHPNILLGRNVCFESLDNVPVGMNLAAPLETDGGSLDLGGRLLCDSGSANMLDNLQTLLQELGLSQALLSQDTDGSLLVEIGDTLVRLNLDPSLEQTGDTSAEVFLDSDGKIRLRLASGLQFTTTPLPVAILDLNSSLNELGLQSHSGDEGQLIFSALPQPGALSLNVEYLTRADVSAGHYTGELASGLYAIPRDSWTNLELAMLVFTDDSKLLRQTLWPWPRNWSSLRELLVEFSDDEMVSLNEQGIITLTIDGQAVRAVAGYGVHPTSAAQEEAARIELTTDQNGDGVSDALIIYADGSTQLLYLQLP